ncbi:hypothetical protein [Polaromonas sp. SM01]|uniref:hypothetical protein n=1 Tax=Polaromonas sp. SM01 TaxID=3085630 RepID=UPI002981A4DE|nr:hypothetical protein [Polaromonas sp. SM01]MDW5445048.1 hypothetical protein [Polaromonas sp. SM01]
MRSEVTVTFQNHPPLRMDLNEVQPMPHDVARSWLDQQFTQMGCEPLRPTGKLLTADKVLVVAQAAGPQHFAEADWAQAFARAASAALAKPVVHIDVPAMSISY